MDWNLEAFVIRISSHNLSSIGISLSLNVTVKKDGAYLAPIILEEVYITVDAATRYGIAEALFDPATHFPQAKALGVESGIIDLIVDSVGKTDGDLQPDLYANIVLSGGSSMFPGLRARVAAEVRARVGDGVEVNVVTDSQRKYAAWIGGSMFGSLGTFPQIQLGRQEYNDGGAAAIHRKCF